MNLMDFLDDFGPAVLGPQLLRLLNKIIDDSTIALATNGQDFPSHLSSTLLVLNKRGACGKTDIAKELAVSHQLTTYRIGNLKKLELIQEKRDPVDGRRTVIALTSKGRKQTKKLIRLSKHIESAYCELFEELGVDLFDVVIRARKALEIKPLDERIASQACYQAARQ
jgi:DNA-binding MarR family transcriptional regulator